MIFSSSFPQTGGEWTVLVSDDFNGDAPTYFASASTPILAVYDGDVLSDVDFLPITSHIGTANHNAAYDISALTNPSAKLFVWDSITSGTPLLIEEIDVAEILSEE